MSRHPHPYPLQLRPCRSSPAEPTQSPKNRGITEHNLICTSPGLVRLYRGVLLVILQYNITEGLNWELFPATKCYPKHLVISPHLRNQLNYPKTGVLPNIISIIRLPGLVRLRKGVSLSILRQKPPRGPIMRVIQQKNDT